MKKRFWITTFISIALGLSSFCVKNSFTEAKADALPLPYHSFVFSAINDTVVLKRANNDYVNVDISTYKYFAVDMEISPKVNNQWVVYTLALIDQGNNNIVSLDLSADKLSAAVDYPDGLSAADFTGAGGSPANVRKASGRLNLPTTRQGYFVAQKSSAYYSTIETGFKGTIFYYLPDYISTNFNVLGLKVVNRDNYSNGKSTNIFNSYFCEDITKVASSGFVASGSRLDYDLIRCVSLSGGATIKTVTDVTPGKGLSVTASTTSEAVISFENQVPVSTSTYKYLALDLDIATPTSEGYLNIAPKILDKNRSITNDLTLDYTKAQAAKVDEFPEGLNQSDWAGAVGGTRVNVPNETYTRISYLTNTNNLYVPAKADNSYYLVFKGGARYTTYIYLPDFGVDSFNMNSLSLTSTGASTYTVNQVYLCERVTRIGKSAFTYEPTGNKLVLPIISAYSYNSTLAEATVTVSSDTYYYANLDPAMVNGTIEFYIYKESSNLMIEVIPVPDSGYAVTSLKVNGSPVSLTDDKYVAELTENVTLLAEFEERFEAEAYYLASQGNVVITYNGDYSKVYFAITPKFGYKVSSVMLNGVTIQFNGGVIEADNDKYNLLTVLFAELITIDNIQNGIIEYELNEISQTVTFKVTPADGYELEKFTVNGGEVALTDNTYTTELTSDLFVSATFKSTAAEEESEQEEITPEKENKKTNPYLPITIVLISVGLSLAVAGGIILIIKRKKK